MAVRQLQKPILIGGLSITFGLWLLEHLQHSLMQFGEFGTVGVVALGTGVWYLQRKVTQKRASIELSTPLSREKVEVAIAQTQVLLEQLATEAPDQDLTAFKKALEQLPESLERSELQLAVMGGQSVGKSTLKGHLDQDSLKFVDTPALFIDKAMDTTVKDTADNSDLVLFLVNGDLRDSELQILKQLQASSVRVLLLFNKQDTYVPEERTFIFQQLKQRVEGVLHSEDVLAVTASPAPVKVRKQQEDGSLSESWEQAEVDITAVGDRLSTILSTEQSQLVWATTWRKTQQLKQKIKTRLNEIRRDRALPIIEQYQWISAAAAFANPVAALDLLAIAAINTQMIVDLGEVYQQKFSISQAQTSAGTLGKLMVQLGLVELSTQAIGGMLKSNALTYVAGGAVQGVSAAYLTRIAGLSLIEYFQELEPNTSTTGFNLDKLGQKMQQVFQQNQRTAFLQGFVQQAAKRLSLSPSA